MLNIVSFCANRIGLYASNCDPVSWCWIDI